ncbi:hypothetical protein [Roseateles paludis]|jgi:hypothetical protein|uniref:Uncharacterized protein n=1 Tax=Roseateles paludis TaxID=3145238 RepID=A0ABV0FXZ4_9BURK
MSLTPLIWLTGLALPLVGLALWAGPTLWRSLTARYDIAALRPTHPDGADAVSARTALDAEILAWSQADLGTGRAPFWRPGALPDVAQRMSVAVLTGPAPTGQIEALARQLDRDDELAVLAAQSKRQAIALKLAVKWHELWWWRARHPRQAWDCGWLRKDVEALASFRPRRPTLLIAQGLPAPTVTSAVQHLLAAHASYRHAVRLLVLAAAMPQGLVPKLAAAGVPLVCIDAQGAPTPASQNGLAPSLPPPQS